MPARPACGNRMLTSFAQRLGMSCYRRMRLPGATCFFTLNLAQPGMGLLTDHIDALRRAYGAMMAEMPVRTEAIVVLPDHLHAIWTLPAGDHGYGERWRRIKARFSRELALQLPRSASKARKRETGIWQRRFWEHTIRDRADFQLHMDYCRGDPVRHGLVAEAADWPFSSIHRDIRQGLIPPDWMPNRLHGRFGE